MVDHRKPHNFTEILSITLAPQLAAEAQARGDYTAAVRHHELTAENDPDLMERARAYMQAGRLRLMLRQQQEAEKALRHAQETIRTLPERHAREPDCHGGTLGRQDDWIPTAVAVIVGYEKEKADDIGIAESAYRVAIDLGHPTHKHHAVANLGALLYDRRGRPEEARALWEGLLASNADWCHRSQAAANLGYYWENAGDRRRARWYYWFAVRTPALGAREQRRYALRHLLIPHQRE